MEKKAKKKTWTKFRHKVITELARWILGPYCYLRYHIKIDKFKQQEKRPYLVLLNHQTPFDQFFVGLAFRGPIYYMATEDIFSLGWVSKVIRYIIAPIPIKKQTTDIQAVMNCMRVVREGGTVCIAPEGNRTYSGRTEYMNPAIVPLVKKLKVPVCLFRIEGGYGVEPRWSDVVRKGNMRGYIAEVITPEECARLSNEELLERIRTGLAVNEDCLSGTFRHKKLAEYLERAIYVCPYCGLSHFHSENDIITCKQCHRQIRYLPTKELQGVGFEFPFRFVAQWYRHQCDFVNGLNVLEHTAEPLYRDTAKLSEVIVYDRKRLLRESASFALYGDRIVIDEDKKDRLVIPFEEASVLAVLGRNKLNIYHGGKVYQVKGDKRMNSLKYVNIFYRYKNIRRGDEHGKFLGL